MSKVRMKDLLPIVAEHYNVKPSDILGKRKLAKFTKPRQVFYWICRLKLEKSYPEIGRFMKRDHTTVLYGARRCREQRWLSIEDADELFEKVSKGDSQ